MRNHWWWQPGWRLDRSFYTWHLTFADQPHLQRLVDHYTPLLATLPTLDPVPPRWLHLTMQGVGFTDQVARPDLDAIITAARHRCSGLEPFTATLGPPLLDPEGIPLRAHPTEPLRRVRNAIRAAIGDVWGTGHIPEPANDDWWPHVTIAYANSTGPADQIAAALADEPPHTANVEITHISLIDLNRDNTAYEWTEVASARLGKPVHYDR